MNIWVASISNGATANPLFSELVRTPINIVPCVVETLVLNLVLLDDPSEAVYKVLAIIVLLVDLKA